MDAWNVVRRNPVVSGLALLAVLALLVVSELTYWQSIASLEDTSPPAEVRAVLQLGRLGIASLGVASLAALFLYLRHVQALKNQAGALRRDAQRERDRLELEVKQRTAELTDLTRHLLAAREDERNHLARELHDELGALLTSAKLDAARIRSRLGANAPEAQERLAHLVKTLDAGIALGRRIGEDLRPSTLSNLGLAAAVDILAREVAEQSGLRADVRVEPVRLSPAAELVAYRVIQEAVTNIVRHAGATRFWITLQEEPGTVTVSIRDDGRGLDPGGSRRSTFGLLGMRCRAEAEHGQLVVESGPGQGTCIRLSLPRTA